MTPGPEALENEESYRKFLNSKFRQGKTSEEILEQRKKLNMDAINNPNNPFRKKKQ